MYLTEFSISLEGDSDIGAINGIRERLRIKIKVDHMHGNRAQKLAGLIKRTYYDKYIVCKDLHTYPQAIINKIYKDTLNNIEKHQHENVRLLVIKHAVEAWFLSDINAINSVFKCNINKEINNPESILDPSQYLHELLNNKGRWYYKERETSRKIMINSDFQKIRSKCKSFDQLLKIFES